MNGATIFGQQIKVNEARPPPPTPLSRGLASFTLICCPKMVAPFICSIAVIESSLLSDVYNTGNGYAFVTFDNKEDSMTAMEQMNGATIFGQQIKVNEARPREGGRGGGGGGRGRGGG